MRPRERERGDRTSKVLDREGWRGENEKKEDGGRDLERKGGWEKEKRGGNRRQGEKDEWHTRLLGGESTIHKPKTGGVDGFGGRRRKGRKIDCGGTE